MSTDSKVASTVNNYPTHLTPIAAVIVTLGGLTLRTVPPASLVFQLFKLAAANGWLLVLIVVGIVQTSRSFQYPFNLANATNFFKLFSISLSLSMTFPLLLCWYWTVKKYPQRLCALLSDYERKYRRRSQSRSLGWLPFVPQLVGLATLLMLAGSNFRLCLENTRTCGRMSLLKETPASWAWFNMPTYFLALLQLFTFPAYSNTCYVIVGCWVEELTAAVREQLDERPKVSQLRKFIKRHNHLCQSIDLYQLALLCTFVPGIMLLCFFIYVLFEQGLPALAAQMAYILIVQTVVVVSIIWHCAALQQAIEKLYEMLSRWTAVTTSKDVELHTTHASLCAQVQATGAPDLCGFGQPTKALLLTLTSFILSFVTLLIQFTPIPAVPSFAMTGKQQGGGFGGGAAANVSAFSDLSASSRQI